MYGKIQSQIYKFFPMYFSYKNFCSTKPISRIIMTQKNSTMYDLTFMKQKNKFIQCAIVRNNQLNQKLLKICLPHCQNLILADGGANQIYDSQFRDFANIKAIIGNLDCIRPDVHDYYLKKGIFIKYSKQQQVSDFRKSLDYCMKKQWYKIFVFGAFGGRMDKTLGGMHLATKFTRAYPSLQIILFGKSNIMIHIKKKTKYVIKIQENFISRYGCGLISFETAKNVTTNGFKWNLGGQNQKKSLEWGQFISTSNQLNGTKCQIESSDNIFFVGKYAEQLIMID